MYRVLYDQTATNKSANKPANTSTNGTGRDDSLRGGGSQRLATHANAVRGSVSVGEHVQQIHGHQLRPGVAHPRHEGLTR